MLRYATDSVLLSHGCEIYIVDAPAFIEARYGGMRHKIFFRAILRARWLRHVSRRLRVKARERCHMLYAMRMRGAIRQRCRLRHFHAHRQPAAGRLSRRFIAAIRHIFHATLRAAS